MPCWAGNGMRRFARPLLALAIMLAAGIAGLAFAAEAIFARVVEARLEAGTGHRWSVAGKPRLALQPEFSVVIRDLDATTDLGPAGVARVEVPTVTLFGSLVDLLAGARVSRIEFERPVARLPADWWRPAPVASRPKEPSGAPDLLQGLMPDRVSVRDGSIRLIDAGEGVESAITLIDVDAVAGPSAEPWTVKASARLGTETVRSALTFGPWPQDGRNGVPVGFRIEAPGLIEAPITGTTKAGAEGAVVTLSALAGSLGSNRFTGAIVIDLRAKPFVRVDLGFPTLAIAGRQGAPGRGAGAWRLDPDGVAALKMFDGRLKLYAGTLEAGPASLAEVSAEAELADGNVKLALARASLYGGEAEGTVTVSPSGSMLRHTLSARVASVRGSRFLSDVSGFTMLDGVASAVVELKGSGWGSDEIARTLSGSADIDVKEGRLNQMNLPSLARLMASQMSGAGPGDADATAFDRVSARFDVKDGRASTADMTMRGPVVIATGTGSIDLLDRTLSFRINPQLAGSRGPGAGLAGLGVPVVIEGPWDAPRIAPDLGAVTLPEAGLGGVINGLLGDRGGGLGKLLESIVPGAPPWRGLDGPGEGRSRPGVRRPDERR